MSITAAIADRYDNDTDADITTLRGNVGTDKLWVGNAPEDTALPYITVMHVSTATDSQTKGQNKRVEDAIVQFDVWAKTKAEVETILNQLDDAYIGHRLTISNRSYKASHPNNRMVEERRKALWRGLFEVRILLEKS